MNVGMQSDAAFRGAFDMPNKKQDVHEPVFMCLGWRLRENRFLDKIL